jgi:hypothetical protein
VIGVKYRDRCSEGIMGGPLERALGDDELTREQRIFVDPLAARREI